jgi:hypothetical protein
MADNLSLNPNKVGGSLLCRKDASISMGSLSVNTACRVATANDVTSLAFQSISSNRVFAEPRCYGYHSLKNAKDDFLYRHLL